MISKSQKASIENYELNYVAYTNLMFNCKQRSTKPLDVSIYYWSYKLIDSVRIIMMQITFYFKILN